MPPADPDLAALCEQITAEGRELAEWLHVAGRVATGKVRANYDRIYNFLNDDRLLREVTRLRAELAGRTPGPVDAEAIKAADRVLHSFDEPYYEPDVSLACRELLRLADVRRAEREGMVFELREWAAVTSDTVREKAFRDAADRFAAPVPPESPPPARHDWCDQKGCQICADRSWRLHEHGIVRRADGTYGSTNNSEGI